MFIYTALRHSFRRQPRLRDRCAPAYTRGTGHGSQSPLFQAPAFAHAGQQRLERENQPEARGKSCKNCAQHRCVSGQRRGNSGYLLASGWRAVSRAMNIGLPEAQIAALCEKVGVRISDIETLPSGGTHLVCITSEGAEEIRRRLKGHLIEGPVKRFPFYHARQD